MGMVVVADFGKELNRKYDIITVGMINMSLEV
jgi:hypothetical protein